MSTEPVVRLDNMTVRYGRLTAVDEVSLEVPQGCVYALLGRNGSGKSSTVRCLLGQRKANKGRAQIFDFDSWKDRARIMERVGVVPENPDIPPEMTAERLERFLARVTPRWKKVEFFERLETFGVPRQQRFDRLSKGQQRQLALAQALAGEPELLVLDDPTLGLDAVARRGLFEELVGELADRGTTVFLTTHDLAGVEGIADRIGVLREGRLLVDEALETLKGRFRRLVWPEVQAVEEHDFEVRLKEVGVISSRKTGGAMEAVIGGYDEVVLSRFRQQNQLAAGRVEDLSLEEIFIALCGEKDGGR